MMTSQRSPCCPVKLDVEGSSAGRPNLWTNYWRNSSAGRPNVGTNRWVSSWAGRPNLKWLLSSQPAVSVVYCRFEGRAKGGNSNSFFLIPGELFLSHLLC